MVALAVVLTAFAVVPAQSMVINLVPGSMLQSNADALAAFQNAANSWAVLFSDPITVTINADLSSGFGDPNIIGSTSAFMLTGGYTYIRGALVLDSAGQADKAIVASLPTAAQYSTYLPSGFGLNGSIILTKANAKALGFTGLDDAPFGPTDATITFNSDFNFYYGTGVFGSGQVDFQTVATHEIGHALGFISAVDTVDTLLHNGTTGALSPAPLDLYRFDSEHLPTDAASFATNPRSLTTGGAAYFSDTQSVYSLSTGFYTGDGRQASHWKDDSLTGTFIGIMDPTLGSQVIEPITAADIRAMELIGYDLAAPEPQTFALMAGALAMVIAAARKRTR
jgi:hypothetical protein